MTPGSRPGYGCCSVVQEASFSPASNTLPLLLLPFVDVICFMCTTQYDLRDLESQISIWCRVHRTTHAEFVMPEIVVLLADDYPLPPQKLRRDIAHRVKRMGIQLEARLSVVKLGASAYAKDGLSPIQTRIAVARARSRNNKVKEKLAFSAENFQELIEHAFLAQKSSLPFRYIEASRTHNPVPSDLVQHLRGLLHVLPEDCKDDFVAESIASALLLDHLTERMHSK